MQIFAIGFEKNHEKRGKIMKRKLIATLLVLGLMLTFAPITIFSTSAADNTWNNDGVTDLYVTTKADLQSFAQAIANGATFSGRTVHIMADIDWGDETCDPSVGGGSKTWPLFYTGTSQFSGMIDGHGHTIKNVNISNGTTPAKGLFGIELLPNDKFTVGVKNLKVENTSVRGGAGTGGLFGKISQQDGNVVLDNLDLDIKVYANGNNGGGMFGETRGTTVTVSNCIFRGSVETNGNNAGGFFGWQADKNLTIANSVVSGTVKASGARSGGFIGHVRENGGGHGSNTQILGCVFDGTITTATSEAFAGGFVGKVGDIYNSAPRPGKVTINDSAFYGTINATSNSPSRIGGLVAGTQGGDSADQIILRRCVVSGAINGVDGATSGGYIRMTVGLVAGGSSLNADELIGQASGSLLKNQYISTTPQGGAMSGIDWSKSNLNLLNGPSGMKTDTLVFQTSDKTKKVDLSDTFVATTSTKPLPMGTVKFYASQMDAIGDGCATGVFGKQTRVEEDGTISVRLIGLAKKDVITLYEAVGLEVVVLRANGADKVKHVDNTDKNANDNKFYTSIYEDGVKKETAELNSNFEYIFTGLFTEVKRDGGELVFVARSFHVENGERVYDDTRVMILDPTTVQ